ncbi:LytTR family DNA-binding domain-containing protein [Novosphingobium ginsenosidimutans]|uniref:LytTR family transcriptional regulator n=1 Tax=Novosphingobium ginsenosidimutans TaxID=1176536 RepID=A0A5B8S3A4_9SPHN|nr:LytTR family DNA-binding domain-containing protein [Novosphingobium ginsenosidimutans]QEA15227.1 LytTR family transcriptional regulator [Novosphingobium ginsenosidimutans]
MTETCAQPAAHPARQIVIDLAVMTVIGVVLAVVGPLGSFDAPFWLRLVYWLGLAWAGYACYRPIGGLVARLGANLDLPEWSLWLLACLIATVPMTVVVWLVEALPPPLEVPSPEVWLRTYGYVLAIGAVVTMVFYLVQSKPPPVQVLVPAAVAVPAEAPAPRPGKPRLFDRLPPALGTELVALEMEDHYLRVHTALGSDLILLRMRDAVAELDGLDGAQVHRSWWVARAAVETVERDGRNVRLVLGKGLVAPVARNMVPVLKSAGWL